MSDQEGFVRPASREEMEAWNAQSVKGIAKDAVADEFSVTREEQTWDYARYHRRYHRTTKDPACRICQLDNAVKQSTQSAPPCKQCGYKLEQHIGPTKECPV